MKKRITAAVMALLVATQHISPCIMHTSAETTTALSARAVMVGDVNADGRITTDDLVPLRDYLMTGKGISPYNWKNSDMNGDGSLDIFDLVFLRKWLQVKRILIIIQD